MFAKGLKAGMYLCTFDRNENMLSFEFNDETRKMLGYDGLEDLPNEFDSWVKTLVPEERDAIVKLFWDSVRIHRDLPDITHATYRMQKKDGSIIWVTGAGRFIRRPDDGSLEIYGMLSRHNRPARTRRILKDHRGSRKDLQFLHFHRCKGYELSYDQHQ